MSRRLLCPAVLALVLALDGGASAADHVFLVGCSEYVNLKSHPLYRSSLRLLGPVNDTALIRDTLVTHLGVPEKNIHMLSGWIDGGEANPTRKNILAGFDRLAKVAKTGDRVLIMMAGHGSQQPDKDDDELDGLDEIFLPADVKGWSGQRGEVENSITDDEIATRIRAIRDTGATVCLLMDCCHAGTMARGDDDPVRSRHLESSILGVPDAPCRLGAVQRSGIPDLDGVAALYAAPSFRPAPEMKLPRGAKKRRWHGLFSFMVASALRRTRGGITFRELHAHVVAGYQALPYRGAVPVAEGDLDLLVGGGRSDRPPLWLRREGEEIVLEAGRLTGVAEGARVRVLDGSGKRLGIATVVDADVTRSRCEVEGFEIPVGRVLPAEIVSVPVADWRLRLAVASPTGKTSSVVSDVLERCETWLVPTEPTEEADWGLAVDASGSLTLRPLRAAKAMTFFVPGGRLESTLKSIYRCENLKRFGVSGLSDPLPTGLTFEVRRIRDGRADPLGAGASLRPGDAIDIRIRNASNAAWDLTVLMLDAHHGVSEVFPRYDSPRLSIEDRKERILGPFGIVDTALGIEHLLVLAVPADGPHPTSLGWLAQDPLRPVTRGASSGGAADLLDRLAFGRSTRGLAASPARVTSRLITWKTAWGDLGPPKDFGPETEAMTSSAPPSETPDVWSLGPRVGAMSSRAGGPRDVLLAGDETPEQVLIDLDGNTPLTDVGKTVKTRAFDAEIAFRFGRDRRTAFYDTDDDGVFDLILIDCDEDPDADVRHVLKNGRWTVDRDVTQPWLRTGYLKFPGAGKVGAKLLFLRK